MRCDAREHASAAPHLGYDPATSTWLSSKWIWFFSYTTFYTTVVFLYFYCLNMANISSIFLRHIIISAAVSLVNCLYLVRFEAFTAVTMKNAVFLDVALCTSCVNRRFRGTYRLHHQARLQPPAHAGSSLADFSSLKMEAIRSSETSVYTRSTRRHIPENGILLFMSCWILSLLAVCFMIVSYLIFYF
jgi:hypothetical protein